MEGIFGKKRTLIGEKVQMDWKKCMSKQSGINAKKSGNSSAVLSQGDIQRQICNHFGTLIFEFIPWGQFVFMGWSKHYEPKPKTKLPSTIDVAFDRCREDSFKTQKSFIIRGNLSYTRTDPNLSSTSCPLAASSV